MSYISFIALQETIRILWFTIFLCFTKLAALAMLKLLSIHMNNIENLLSDPLIKDMEKQKSEALKNLFGNRIKQTFLRSMERMVLNKMAFQLGQYYPESFAFNGDTMLRGNVDGSFEFEICRMIVGVHRNNVMYLDDNERAKLQNDSSYQDKLCNQVITHIKLRQYSGKFARRFQLIAGDEFLFFPVPYKLLAMTMRSLSILAGNQNVRLFDMYTLIFNKTLSVLCLLENNMFDSAYPICRAIIEIFVKLHVLILNPNAVESYKKFCSIELEKGCDNGLYPVDFDDLYENRKYASEKSKINFLHFGWVDLIPDYGTRVNQKHYSFEGLCSYLDSYYTETTAEEVHNFSDIMQMYNFCHTFTHGTTGNTGYPLAHYLNIASILSVTTEKIYRMLCDDTNISNFIDDVDIISEFDKDFEQLNTQIKTRSTEKFKNYYKTFNALK